MQPKSGDMNHSPASKDMMRGNERPAVVAASPAYGADSKMVPTKGPSHMGMGNISDRTNSHNVPARKEMASPTYGNDTMVGQPKSGEDRLSPAVKNEVPKSWKKKGYSNDTPSSLPAGNLKSKWEQ